MKVSELITQLEQFGSGKEAVRFYYRYLNSPKWAELPTSSLVVGEAGEDLELFWDNVAGINLPTWTWEVVKRFEKEETIVSICKDLGVNQTEVSLILRMLGYRTQRQPRRRKERDERLWQDWQDGMTQKQLAEKYGITRTRVYQVLQRQRELGKGEGE